MDQVEHGRERLAVQQQASGGTKIGEDVDHRGDLPARSTRGHHIGALRAVHNARLPAAGDNSVTLRRALPRRAVPSDQSPMLANRIVPLIVAVALFMENMDSTVIATSLPAIAADIGTNPLALKLAITSYLLSLAVFLPVSGWTADRFGARTVFRAAIAVFMLGLDRLRAVGLAHPVRDRAHRRGHGRRHDDAGRPPDPGAHRRQARAGRRHDLGHHAGADRAR